MQFAHFDASCVPVVARPTAKEWRNTAMRGKSSSNLQFNPMLNWIPARFIIHEKANVILHSLDSMGVIAVIRQPGCSITSHPKAVCSTGTVQQGHCQYLTSLRESLKDLGNKGHKTTFKLFQISICHYKNPFHNQEQFCMNWTPIDELMWIDTTWWQKPICNSKT